MAGEGDRVPLVLRHLVGVARRIDQRSQQLLADAFHRVRIEARLAEGELQQLRRLVAVLGERLEVSVEGVLCLLVVHAHGQILHALLEVARFEVAGAFIEHGGDEVGEPFLAERVLRAAALEGEAHGHHRHCMLFDQPGLDAAGALHGLDFHGVCGKAQAGEECHGKRSERGGDRRRAESGARGRRARRAGGDHSMTFLHIGDHERECATGCSTGGACLLGVLRLRQQPAGHRAAGVEIVLRRLLDVVGGDFGERCRPAFDVGRRAADGDRPAVAAGEVGLVVALVDVVGEQRLLGALELERGDAVLADVVEHAVDGVFDRLQVAAARYRVERDGAGIQVVARVVAAGRRRDLVLDDELAIEAAGRAVGEDLHQADRALRLRPACRSRSSAPRSSGGTRHCRRAGPSASGGERKCAAAPAGASACRPPGLPGSCRRSLRRDASPHRR